MYVSLNHIQVPLLYSICHSDSDIWIVLPSGHIARRHEGIRIRHGDRPAPVSTIEILEANSHAAGYWAKVLSRSRSSPADLINESAFILFNDIRLFVVHKYILISGDLLISCKDR